MNLAVSHFQMKPPFARGCTWRGRLGLPGCRHRSRLKPARPDPDKIVDRARHRAHAELNLKGAGYPTIGPAPLAKSADQLRIGLKLALGGPAIGPGEEVCDLLVEVHARVASSTVRRCSVLFDGNSADDLPYSGLFGSRTLSRPNRPEFARTPFGSVRACSAVGNRRTTYCVSPHNIGGRQFWRCCSKVSCEQGAVWRGCGGGEVPRAASRMRGSHC